MEDRNMLVSDCIVVCCCCCQCMILQILVFVLLKLPNKVLKKTKKYVRKLRTQRKGAKFLVIELSRYGDDSFRGPGTSFRIKIEDFSLNGFGSCDEEVDRVMEELSNKGMFAFGSFWGGDDEASTRSFSSCVEEGLEIDYGVVQCRLIELFGSVDFRERIFSSC